MFHFLKALTNRAASHSNPRPAPTAKLAVEGLECRTVPSVANSVATVTGIKDFYIDFGKVYENQVAILNNASPAISVSAAKDANGFAHATIVLKNGNMYDFFDKTKVIKLEATGVTASSAGADFDAVIKTGGVLVDFDPVAMKVKAKIQGANVTSADAGQDADGKAMVAYTDLAKHAHEWRLGNGAGYTEALGANIKQVSAGFGGRVALLTTGGAAFEHTDAAYAGVGGAFTGPGTFTLLTTGAVAVSEGTDPKGKGMTDVILANGDAWEHSDSTGWEKIGVGATEVDAGTNGISDVVTNAKNGGVGNDIYRYMDAGLDHKDTFVWLLRNDLG